MHSNSSYTSYGINAIFCMCLLKQHAHVYAKFHHSTPSGSGVNCGAYFVFEWWERKIQFLDHSDHSNGNIHIKFWVKIHEVHMHHHIKLQNVSSANVAAALEQSYQTFWLPLFCNRVVIIAWKRIWNFTKFGLSSLYLPPLLPLKSEVCGMMTSAANWGQNLRLMSSQKSLILWQIDVACTIKMPSSSNLVGTN